MTKGAECLQTARFLKIFPLCCLGSLLASFFWILLWILNKVFNREVLCENLTALASIMSAARLSSFVGIQFPILVSNPAHMSCARHKSNSVQLLRRLLHRRKQSQPEPGGQKGHSKKMSVVPCLSFACGFLPWDSFEISFCETKSQRQLK